MNTQVFITNIHENRHHPGVIYAELRDVEGGATRIGATLEYIFSALRASPEYYDCVNVTMDGWGNQSVSVPPFLGSVQG